MSCTFCPHAWRDLSVQIWHLGTWWPWHCWVKGWTGESQRAFPTCRISEGFSNLEHPGLTRTNQSSSALWEELLSLAPACPWDGTAVCEGLGCSQSLGCAFLGQFGASFWGILVHSLLLFLSRAWPFQVFPSWIGAGCACWLLDQEGPNLILFWEKGK